MLEQSPPETPLDLVPVLLTAAQANALLQLCDAVALRGPESKILVAQAQAAILQALRG